MLVRYGWPAHREARPRTVWAHLEGVETADTCVHTTSLVGKPARRAQSRAVRASLSEL